jgi:Tol biopolymer transport system component
LCAAWIAALAFAGTAATGLASPTPEGPRLAVVKFGVQPPRLDLLTVDATGALPQRVVGKGGGRGLFPQLFVPPAWSPDGSSLAFTGWVGSIFDDEPALKIFVVNADGSDARAIPHTEVGLNPVFAPGGQSIAFARLRDEDEISTWMVDLDGTNRRQITPWKKGLEVSPSSFSPDGTILAVSRDRAGHRNPQAVAIRLDGSGSTVLANHASEPVYSPDGSQIAFVRTHFNAGGKDRRNRSIFNLRINNDLVVAGAAGGQPHRLTRTPGRIEIWPSWDPSGERLSFARFRGKTVFDLIALGNSIFGINADGTCATRILATRDAAYYGAAWRPGPGREAGRIDC